MIFMGKGKKKQKSLEIVLDDDFSVNSAATGAKLVDLGLWPDFSECIFFHENFEDKLYSNVQHLLDNRQERKNYHPHHHLYVGEILMKLGFAALGRTFETIFSDELGFYRTLFKEFMGLQPDIYNKYAEFRKNGLRERLDVLKRHCLRGYIKAKKSDLQQMKDTIEMAKKKNIKCVALTHVKPSFRRKEIENLMEMFSKEPIKIIIPEPLEEFVFDD